MITFIKKKLWIIQFQAKRSEKNLFFFFLGKTINWIDRQMALLLDLLTLILLLPVAAVCRLMKRVAEKKAIFFGLEHVVDKIVLRGEYFESQGYDVNYFSFDYSGLRSNRLREGSVVKFRKYFFLDIYWIFKKFYYPPLYTEFYFEGNGIRQFFISLLIPSKHCVKACIDRGVLGFIQKTNITPFLYGVLCKQVYRFSQLILVRDPDMYEYLKQQKIFSACKIILDYNRTKIYEFDEDEFVRKNLQKSINVLFLNGFSLERSPELLVKAIPYVLQKNPNVRFIIVGPRNELERRRVTCIAQELNVQDKIDLYNWDANPQNYYEKSHIYVLTAEFIFCNNALIEAMERGLVPITSDVEKADMIIKDGINGFLSPDTVLDLSAKINMLIEHPQLRIKMGKKARSTITEDFNIQNRMDPVEDAIRAIQVFKSKLSFEE
jgi:glycosyltransferase involved in cell wall biosynthesis